MRGDAHRAELVHEAFGVVVLVAADRHAMGVGQSGNRGPAASRSAVPVACVTSASMIKP